MSKNASGDAIVENLEDLLLLKQLLLTSISKERLFGFASRSLSLSTDNMSCEQLVDRIIESRCWNSMIDELDINDFRVCSECGRLMHQGYCVDMGRTS